MPIEQTNIPSQAQIDFVARLMLPHIQEFFESEDGQKEFEKFLQSGELVES